MRTITVTIQIGNTDGKLTQDQWAAFVESVRILIGRESFTIHFFGGSSCWEKWQNVSWVFLINESEIPFLKKALKDVRSKFSQDSIAWTEGETEFV